MLEFTDNLSVHAYPAHRLVILELHHNISLSENRPIRLPNLLDESPPAHPQLSLRHSPRNPQSHPSPKG